MSTSLEESVSCPVYRPGAAEYAPEAAGFNTAVLHRPDVVVAARTAADIQGAVAFARAHGLRVSVQGAAHGAHAPIVGGLLVSTRCMTAVSVDAAARTATVAAGATWVPVITAAAAHGLMPVAGSSPIVGVVGYLAGGGLGPLARSHGFSSDYVLGHTVVTGAGDVVRADVVSHPDLFWALRGGKSGLGIVTELRLRLVPLRTLYGGFLAFDEPHIEAALRRWIDWTATADARVTTSVAIVRFPPFEAIPAPFRGRRVLLLRFAFPGAPEDGERFAAPLRAAAPVHVDTLGEMPAAELGRIHADPTEPGPFWANGGLLTGADQKLASALLGTFGAGADGPFALCEVRHLGEATKRDVDGGSAVGGRSGAFTVAFAGVNPDQFAAALPAAAEKVHEALRPWAARENNINFLGASQLPQQLASAWPPAAFARLAEVRHRYDPEGVLAFGA